MEAGRQQVAVWKGCGAESFVPPGLGSFFNMQILLDFYELDTNAGTWWSLLWALPWYCSHSPPSTSIFLSVCATIMPNLMGIRYKDAPRHLSQYKECSPSGTSADNEAPQPSTSSLGMLPVFPTFPRPCILRTRYSLNDEWAPHRELEKRLLTQPFPFPQLADRPGATSRPVHLQVSSLSHENSLC